MSNVRETLDTSGVPVETVATDTRNPEIARRLRWMVLFRSASRDPAGDAARHVSEMVRSTAVERDKDAKRAARQHGASTLGRKP